MGLIAVIWAVIVGFVVGALARWLMPGPVEMGFWLTAAIGIGGSIVGGLIGSILWKSPSGKFRPAGLVMSVLGALIVLWAWRNFIG